MRSVNRVTLLGNLGQVPEVSDTKTGKLCQFSVATSTVWKDKESQKMNERTQWHRCVAWGKLAELIEQHADKGERIYLTGRLETNAYVDKEGVQRYSTQIVADEVILL